MLMCCHFRKAQKTYQKSYDICIYIAIKLWLLAKAADRWIEERVVYYLLKWRTRRQHWPGAKLIKQLPALGEGWVFFHYAPAVTGRFYYCPLSDWRNISPFQLSESLRREISSWHATSCQCTNTTIRLAAYLVTWKQLATLESNDPFLK